MADPVNCWEFKKCGREPGGAKVAALGVCPATTAVAAGGLNRGRAGGRICWALAGTFCGGVVQGSFAQKRHNCMSCEFFAEVERQEGETFSLLQPGQLYEEPQ